MIGLLIVILLILVALYTWKTYFSEEPLWPGGAPRAKGELPLVGSGIEFTLNVPKFFLTRYEKYGESFSFTRFGTSWTAISNEKDMEVFYRGSNYSFEEAYQKFLGSFWPSKYPFVNRQPFFNTQIGNSIGNAVEQVREALFEKDFLKEKIGKKWDLFDDIYNLMFDINAVAFIGPGIKPVLREFKAAYFDANPESSMVSTSHMIRLLVNGIDKPFEKMLSFLTRILDEEIEKAGGVEFFFIISFLLSFFLFRKKPTRIFQTEQFLMGSLDIILIMEFQKDLKLR